MKKSYLFLASAALVFASCANDDYVGVEDGNKTNYVGEITFQSNTGALTRADLTHTETAEALENNFVVVGYKGSATAAANTGIVFDHYNVNYVAGTANTTTSNSKDWEYVAQDQKVKGTAVAKADWTKLADAAVQAQTIKYWDHAAASYDFLAFSMGKGDGVADPDTKYATPTAVNKANLATAAYTLTGDATTLGECYISNITTVKEEDYSTTPVTLKFRHLTSKVRLALFEQVPGYVIKDVKFRQTLTDSHDPATSDNGILIGTDAFNEKGTLTVYFPTTGTDNESNSDYNKAHVSFAPAASDGTSSKKTFGVVDYHNDAEDVIAAGTTYLAQTAANCSYVKNAAGTVGGYDVVLPHENNSKVLSIQIDYTLVSTDGSGEEIKVYGARADIPKEYTAWTSGYAYTYKFKISQNTNGHTGTDVDDKGLTAITFDAVVMNDEANGLQETITTVATPSITTYGYIASSNTVSVDADEYAPGTDIYATVSNSGTSVAPTALYTVTIESGAAQTINEASVANAIKNGAQAGDPLTYTVHDANGKNMVVTTATASATINASTEVPTSADTHITVAAMKWTAGATGTVYAVEYTSGGEKHYKIVRIK